MTKIKVLVVDDHELMSQALQHFINSTDDLESVGSAKDGVEAIARTAELQPDVVLMDMQMPRMDGVEATQRILASDHRPAVVAITTFATDEYVVPAFGAGVQGFIVKDSKPHEVAEAVRQAHQGMMTVSPAVAKVLVQSALEAPAKKLRTDDLLEPLTSREQEVLTAVGTGLSNKDIGAQLFVTEATVKAHIGRMMMKFGVQNRVQLVVAATRAGLIDL
ncbi:response regulator [Neomicrococcus lactis]|uniref:DNA-binding NarL/FixJ family response regulator n=1 Tax=Neomicrococcus lactis TaxID=732241 RepID=A0A7W9DBJ1_9MICC|nr:response regulator transcription factor [Neomicrococcus lactis]MBB5598579.1 DNA-binding NarL/FixJ family response regulator [Neomicrococcus lactis]